MSTYVVASTHVRTGQRFTSARQRERFATALVATLRRVPKVNTDIRVIELPDSPTVSLVK
jgi:hypothetical protein